MVILSKTIYIYVNHQCTIQFLFKILIYFFLLLINLFYFYIISTLQENHFEFFSFQILTFIFTGKLIKFGNFSCLPKAHVEQLIQKPYLWNSYSSSVVRIINNRTFVPSTRGLRYVLPSKMNFTSLIFHSLSIISVFRNAVIMRSIIFFLVYLFLIYNNISILVMFPVFCLLVFLFIILIISKRAQYGRIQPISRKYW